MTALGRVVHEGRTVRGPFALALLIGSATAAVAIALTATSAWLISRASQQPPVLYLMVAIVAVRAFGIARGVLRYLERLTAHDAAFRVLADLRVHAYQRLERLAPAGLDAYRSGDLLARLVGDIDGLADLWLRVLLPYGSAVIVGGLTVLVRGLAGAGGGPRPRVDPGRGGGRRPARGHPGRAPRGRPHLTAPRPLGGRGAGRGPRRPRDRRRRRDGAPPGRPCRHGRRGPRCRGRSCGRDRCRRLGDRAGVRTRGVVCAGRRRAGRGGRSVGGCAPCGGRAHPDGRPRGRGRTRLRSPAAPRPDRGGHPPRSTCWTDRTPPSNPPIRGPCPGDRSDCGSGAWPPATPPTRRCSAMSTWRSPPVASPWSPARAAPGRARSPRSWSGSSDRRPAASSWSGPTRSIAFDDLAGDDIRAAVGLCAQDVHVFDTSIAENVRFARPEADDGAIRRALRQAGLANFVDALPNGIATMVGEHGARLSGGQRQRLGLARVLLADRRIVVFDEPTEHVDELTAGQLVTDLLAASAGRTVILITHQPSVMAAVHPTAELALPG